MRKILGWIAACVILLVPQMALASVVLENTTGSTDALLVSGALTGQTFSASGQNRLESFGFKMASSSVTYYGTVYELDTVGNPLATPIWRGPDVTRTSFADEIVMFTPNLVLDPTKSYYASVNVTGGSATVYWGNDDLISNSYLLSYYSSSGWDHLMAYEFNFIATLNTVASTVPTLSEWAMILFGGLVALGGAALVWRRITLQTA